MSFRQVKGKGKKSDKGKGKVSIEDSDIVRESLWDFTEVHDVATISGQLIYEAIRQHSSASLAAYSELSDASNLDLNKSDITCLITAAILARLGMAKASEDVLSNSDEVAKQFTSLNLREKPTLNMFCIMIGVLNPEIIKMIELGIMDLMAKKSKQTKAIHSMSRLEASISDLTIAGHAAEKDISISRYVVGAYNKNTINFVTSRMIEDEDHDNIHPSESSSDQGMSPRAFNESRKEVSATITEEDIRNYIMDKQLGLAKTTDFASSFPSATKPVQANPNKGRAGLGYAAKSRKNEFVENALETGAIIIDAKSAIKKSEKTKTDAPNLISDFSSVLNKHKQIEEEEASDSSLGDL